MNSVPPTRIVIDFLEGITLKKDAIAYARGFIESHFEVPVLSSYYVAKFGNGYVYEVHEGGNHPAYLPSILQTITDNPAAVVSIRAGKRVLQVSRGARDGFNAVLLPEELSSYLDNVIEPDEKGPVMIPYQTPGLVWLVTGFATALVGAIIFLFALGFFAFDRLGDKPPQLAVTPAAQLPLSQWDTIAGQLKPNTYIEALRFQNGVWSNGVKTVPVAEPAVAKPAPVVETKPPVSSVPAVVPRLTIAPPAPIVAAPAIETPPMPPVNEATRIPVTDGEASPPAAINNDDGLALTAPSAGAP